jgi:hypothetical protein
MSEGLPAHSQSPVPWIVSRFSMSEYETSGMASVDLAGFENTVAPGAAVVAVLALNPEAPEIPELHG